MISDFYFSGLHAQLDFFHEGERAGYQTTSLVEDFGLTGWSCKPFEKCDNANALAELIETHLVKADTVRCLFCFTADPESTREGNNWKFSHYAATGRIGIINSTDDCIQLITQRIAWPPKPTKERSQDMECLALPLDGVISHLEVFMKKVDSTTTGPSLDYPTDFCVVIGELHDFYPEEDEPDKEG